MVLYLRAVAWTLDDVLITEELAGRPRAPDYELEARALGTLAAHLVQDAASVLRAVVDLTYFHGFAYAEIAEIMDCPVDTVKTRMFHARRHLKRMLAGELSDWL